MILKKLLPASVIALTVLGGFSCSRVKKPAAQIEREKWIESFNDSVKIYKERSESASKEIGQLHDEATEQLKNFEFVNGSKEGTGFYIYKGWRGRMPLQSSGLTARISEKEQLEIMATFTGGIFTQMVVSDGSSKYTTHIITYDKAVANRVGDRCSVGYFGASADSIAMIVADISTNPISISYLNGKTIGTITLPADQKNMILETYRLYQTLSAVHKMEKDISVYSKKIDIFRKMMERDDTLRNRKK